MMTLLFLKYQGNKFKSWDSVSNLIHECFSCVIDFPSFYSRLKTISKSFAESGVTVNHYFTFVKSFMSALQYHSLEFPIYVKISWLVILRYLLYNIIPLAMKLDKRYCLYKKVSSTIRNIFKYSISKPISYQNTQKDMTSYDNDVPDVNNYYNKAINRNIYNDINIGNNNIYQVSRNYDDRGENNDGKVCSNGEREGNTDKNNLNYMKPIRCMTTFTSSSTTSCISFDRSLLSYEGTHNNILKQNLPVDELEMKVHGIDIPNELFPELQFQTSSSLKKNTFNKLNKKKKVSFQDSEVAFHGIC